ncbi:hypothetical protein Vretimale_15444 [Volvox reticuliferus]|uniref:RNase H type-1 domain-containing protein n=1 Tax=Volvox reticuliferus TaxID=1737510 RepID=A0A8J4G1N6_9CHLO|nr:hypothetical protein Vretifemale_20494 [Volvox reticuliferus]GIM12055.1 hypothetical protein Vretimale_15444 [Volvox reticuliferus]
MGKVYAVRVGQRTGIYNSWAEVKPLVHGYPGAQHKSFNSWRDAEDYLAAGPARPAERKRSRDDGYNYEAHGHDSDDWYAELHERPAQVRRSEPVTKRDPHPVVTCGVLIASGPRVAPPAPAYNSSYRAGGSSGSRSRFDPVVEGPRQAIKSGSVYELEFDGAARGNPGHAGCGAVLRYNGDVVCRLRKYMGSHSTNNEAEYTALIEGLQMARRLGVTRVHAKGDSKLVVQQVTGSWQIHKPHLQDLCNRVHNETRNLREFEIRHIRREFNTEADKLSNDAIDLA